MKKLIILFLLLSSIIAYAEQQLPVYQVDIVAFKDIKGLQNLPVGQWLLYQPPDFKNVLVLNQQSGILSIEQNQKELYVPLPDDRFILNKDAARIQNSKLYSFITQQSWLQQVLAPSQTQTVLINAGQNYSQNYSPASQTDGNPVWELTGTVKITNSLYQYLTLKVNFYLTEPGTDAAKNTAGSSVTSEYQGLQMIEMKENRRIKVDQLNYIDSPGFGLLIKVVKVPELKVV